MAKGKIVFDEEISEVGYWEASEWGASVTSYDVIENPEDRWNPLVRYFAIEHGERFYFDIDLSTVLRKYKDLQKYGC